jgi:dTDP-4-amino-4,6-dideoxygalactose transaminase
MTASVIAKPIVSKTPVSKAPRAVPFFNYPNVFTAHEEEFVALFREVGRSGAFIMQKHMASFEQNLAAFTGAQYALGVGNATDGLLYAMRAAGIGHGDEVILSSHTMVATAAAIHFAGATPIPVNCGADHLIDPAAVEAAITPRTRAIMPTQLNGRTCDMDALCNLASRKGLLIVEDAAQGLGSKFKGRSAGTFGIASAISFYPAKVLGCFGDGGAVLTNDAQTRDRVYQMRDHGRDADGRIASWGLNSRLDNLQAAFLDVQLARYENVIARRRELAAMYDERLRDVAELVLPPAPGSDPDRFDVFQNYEIEAERRDDLKIFLKLRGVGTLIQWGGQAVHQLRELGFTQDLPQMDLLFTRMLMLPLNLSLVNADVEFVCGVIREFYGR